ncbi:hypothetical protein BH10BDE1_BH10BDE1_29410 [soil metagenome]
MISDNLRRELDRPIQPRTQRLVTPVKPSVAQLMGHAIHPILVAFPITFYAIATASFITFAVNDSAFWFRVGFYASLAGVIAAVVAAIPGMVDYFGSIPKSDPAKKVGGAHIAFNMVSLLLFASIVVLLWDIFTPSTVRTEAVNLMAPMWLSIVGMVSTLVGGYLGGSLVQEHHVGIEPSVRNQSIQPRTSLS